MAETALDHALDLCRRGLSVIPVPRPCPGVPAAWRESDIEAWIAQRAEASR